MRYGIRDPGYAIRDAGSGMRDARYGMRDASSEIQDAGFAIRDSKRASRIWHRRGSSITLEHHVDSHAKDVGLIRDSAQQPWLDVLNVRGDIEPRRDLNLVEQFHAGPVTRSKQGLRHRTEFGAAWTLRRPPYLSLSGSLPLPA